MRHCLRFNPKYTKNSKLECFLGLNTIIITVNHRSKTLTPLTSNLSDSLIGFQVRQLCAMSVPNSSPSGSGLGSGFRGVLLS